MSEIELICGKVTQEISVNLGRGRTELQFMNPGTREFLHSDGIWPELLKEVKNRFDHLGPETTFHLAKMKRAQDHDLGFL